MCEHRRLSSWGVLALGLAAMTAAALGQEPRATVDRYATRDPAALTVARSAVTRQDYVDLVRPEARGFESGPDRGQYGPRHALPALAVFSLEGDRSLGEGIKKTLRHYADWVRASIEKELRRRGHQGPLEQVRPQGRPAAESEDDDVETPATRFNPPVYRGDDVGVTWFADTTGNGAVSLDYD